MLNIRQIDGITILGVSAPRLDASIAFRFREESLNYFEEKNPDGNVVIDFSEVTFLDSSGLGALVSLVKRISRTSRPVICCLQPAVKTMFSLTRMDKVFMVYDTIEEAVAHFGN